MERTPRRLGVGDEYEEVVTNHLAGRETVQVLRGLVPREHGVVEGRPEDGIVRGHDRGGEKHVGFERAEGPVGGARIHPCIVVFPRLHLNRRRPRHGPSAFLSVRSV